MYKAGSSAWQAYEPVGPIYRALLAPTQQMIGMVPIDKHQDRWEEAGILADCWLVQVEDKPLLERPREGKRIEWRDLDYYTSETHRLHKMSGLDWLGDIIQYKRETTWSVDGLPVRFAPPPIPVREPTAEELEARLDADMDKLAEKMVKAEYCCLGDGFDWLRKIARAQQILGQPILNEEPKLSPTITVHKKRKSNLRPVAPEISAPWMLGWHVGNAKECARYVKSVLDYSKPKIGKQVAERMRLDTASAKVYYDYYYYEQASDTMRCYVQLLDRELLPCEAADLINEGVIG